MIDRDTAIQFLRFCVVGLFGAVAHYSTLIGAVELFGVNPVIASTLGFTAGGAVNYTLARFAVFETDRRHREALPRFLAVAFSGLILNGAAMTVLVEWLAFYYLPSQVLVTGCLIVWHYAANRFWSFSASSKPKAIRKSPARDG